MAPNPEQVDRIRRFNRFYVQRMGLYARDYLGTGLGVTDWRVLYEIDSPDRPSARKIAERLELDEAQVSRILARFREKGWLAQCPSAGDRRRKTLALTAAGHAAHADATARIGEDFARRLDGLDLPAVLGAMDELEGRMTPVRTEDIAIRALAPGDMGWILERHGAYCHDRGFNAEFEALVARILADAHDADPSRNRGFLAHSGADRMGSVHCTESAVPGLAQLRILWVEPRARGTGLGTRLVETCLAFARSAGFGEITLLTLSSQQAARRLYARAGFALKSSEPRHAFGTHVVAETWSRPL